MHFHIMKKQLKDFKVEASPHKKTPVFWRWEGDGEGFHFRFWVLTLYTVCQNGRLKLWLKKKRKEQKTVKP